jgi:hypothetical protein
MMPVDQVRALFAAILEEIERNPKFADAVNAALAGSTPLAREHPPRTNVRRSGARRSQSVLDPFSTYEAGESELRERLAMLSVEELKDVVSQYGMDSSRLALKWKTSERLIDLIVARVKARVTKGDAFRE